MTESFDFFSHGILAKGMSKVFSEHNSTGAYVISINGSWGTGKTHLMTKVLSELNPLDYIKVSFNAWRYTEKEDIKRALLVCIVDACRKYVQNKAIIEHLGWNDEAPLIVEQLCDDTERALYTAFTKEILGEVSINTGNLIKSGMNMALKFVPWGNFGNDLIQKLFSSKDNAHIEKEDVEQLWGIFTRSSTKRNIEKITSVEQFRKSFETLLKVILEGCCDEKTVDENMCAHNKDIKLVVAIDDLDRCLPEDALNILEVIKLFVDYPNAYFMIAMDGSVIQKGLDIRYGKYDNIVIRAKDYYEKLVDLSFNMPALANESLLAYIRSLPSSNIDYTRIYDTLLIPLGSNLRAWQRYIYRTDFNKAILEEIAGKDIFNDEQVLNVYLKMQCFSYQWPELYKTIYNVESYLFLEKRLEQISNYGQKSLQVILQELEQLEINESIRATIADKKVMDFILLEPKISSVNHEILNILFTFDKII